MQAVAGQHTRQRALPTRSTVRRANTPRFSSVRRLAVVVFSSAKMDDFRARQHISGQPPRRVETMIRLIGPAHSRRASQRSWSRRTIPNKYGRRQECGCWLQQNDVKMTSFDQPACGHVCWEDLLANRRLQTLLLFWLDVISLENM